MAQFEELKELGIFPLGEKNEAYAQFFTGQSYLKALAQAPDGHFGVGNVTFEPGCRNNWHRHLGGYQILLVTGGQGSIRKLENQPSSCTKVMWSSLQMVSSIGMGRPQIPGLVMWRLQLARRNGWRKCLIKIMPRPIQENRRKKYD